MTPEEEPGPADPDELAEVRRLLASAGLDDDGRRPRTPDDVAARLDDVLTDLVAARRTGEESGPTGAGSTTGATTGATTGTTTGATAAAASAAARSGRDELAERRARRWPQVLVAAAAVSVLALGVGNLLDGSGIGSGGATSSSGQLEGGSADREAGGDAAAGSAQPPPRQRVEPAAPRPQAPRLLDDRGEAEGMVPQSPPPPALVRVSTDTLRSDAQRVADATLPGRRAAELDGPQPGDRSARRDPGPAFGIRCELPSTGPGDAKYAVLLDGRRAVVVFRAPDPAGSETRDVDFYACGDAGRQLGSTVVDVG